MSKKEIKELIVILSNFLRDDANTYLWAKSRKDYLTQNKNFSNSDYSLGGGNFLIVLGSLSFLSLLAKIYKILIDANPLNLLKNNGEFKNETGAVKEFISKIGEEIKIIDNPEDENFWKLLRHGLVHLFFPKGGSSIVAVHPAKFTAGMSLLQYKQSLVTNNDPAIKKKDGGGFYCDADLLAVKVKKAADWLIKYLGQDEVMFNEEKGEAIKKLLGI